MSRISRVLRFVAFSLFAAAFVGTIAGAATWWYLVPRLPSIEILKDVRLQVPLRVYTRDEKLIAEFGEQRRTPLQLAQVPEMMIKAVLAAEDERFYQHPGVDWQGIARAVWHLLRTGEKGPGGSTITMQVARNFFLGSEKTYERKLNEILLAVKIERELTKNEILELYFNKIFLGHRAYGVGAAAQVYYGVDIGQLTLPQIAMIAGLPKAPSRFNPIVNPERAVARRNYVLGRMLDLGFIDARAHDAAAAAPVSASLHGLAVELDAPYVAEMARAHMEQRYGSDAYTGGFKVYTTLDSARQRAATRALRSGLLEYDRRHGYRGPELRGQADAVLADLPVVGDLLPALVVAVADQDATLVLSGGERVTLPWEAMAWARPYVSGNRLGPKPKAPAEVLANGDVVRLERAASGFELAQVPAVEGALVSMDPNDGAIVALVGGFDFYRSKFNRAVQAQRQPGSSFKPFIYSAALESGFTPASIINDAPVVFDDPSLEAAWRPENYSGKFFGPTRLREALTFSRNLVSIRLLQAIGVEPAVEYLGRFGFDTARLPHNLSLALGSAAVSPLEVARGYDVFASGGFLVEPYFLVRIVDGAGAVVMEADPLRVCRPCEKAADAPAAATPVAVAVEPPAEAGQDATAPARLAPRAISAQNAWLMTSMMRDVIQRGTGRRARSLGRSDLAGKTGTTNEQRDAWFSGFTPALVATAWVGFDDLQPLGNRETGGRAALPVWMAYMAEALKGVPEQTLEQPDGLVTVRIDPETGQPAGAGQPDAIFETFRVGQAPTRVTEAPTAGAHAPTVGGVPEQLF